MNLRNFHRAACIGIACSTPVVSLAQTLPDAFRPGERFCDPPATTLPGPADRSWPAPGAWPRGFPETVQVNTSADGMNILGDAANEPSIAVDPTAPLRMAVGFRQFDSITSNFRQAGYAYSIDGGRTWTNGGVIDPGVARSDPVLRSDAHGTFYYNSYQFELAPFQVNLFTSTDGGRTWGGGAVTRGGDKVWFTIDTTEGIGRGNIYQAWNTSLFNRSIDGGLTFDNPRSVSIGWTGTVAVGNQGQVFAVGDQRALVRSVNAQNPGPSYQFQFLTLPMNDLGGGAPNPAGLIGQRWIDVDRSTGPRRDSVYVCDITPGRPGDPADITILRSVNDGTTWSAPVTINSDSASANHWQWFSTMAVAPNGRIDVVWNDTRASNAPSLSETYYASSSDGGATWTNQRAIGPVWNSLHGWPNQNKIGDYYDLHSDNVGADLIYAATYNFNPATSQGEQDVYFVRLGQHDCNGNSIGDESELAADPAMDCNQNGIPDSCEIAVGTLTDFDGNGIPDTCECLADWDSDGTLNSADFFAFLEAFFTGSADVNHDGFSNSQDLFDYLSAFFIGCG